MYKMQKVRIIKRKLKKLFFLGIISFSVFQILLYFFSNPKRTSHINIDDIKTYLTSEETEDGEPGGKDYLGTVLFGDYLEDGVSIDVRNVEPCEDYGRDYIETEDGVKEARLVEVKAYKTVNEKKTIYVDGYVYVITESGRIEDYKSLTWYTPGYSCETVIPTEVMPLYYSYEPPKEYDDIDSDLLKLHFDSDEEYIDEGDILNISSSELANEVYIEYTCDENTSLGKSMSTKKRTLYFDGFNDKWVVNENDQLIERTFSTLDLAGEYSWDNNAVKIEKGEGNKWDYQIQVDGDYQKVDCCFLHYGLDTLSSYGFEIIGQNYGEIDLSFNEPTVIVELHCEQQVPGLIYLICSDSKSYIIDNWNDDVPKKIFTVDKSDLDDGE